MRENISKSLQTAQKEKDQKAVATMRLILAALKDRDIAARAKGHQDGIDDQEILAMLQTMIKQRQESMKLYEQGGRLDLVEQEQHEIEIIKKFLPEQLSEEEMSDVIDGLIRETGAASIKDMGKIMALIREKYMGKMDFGRASSLIKDKLA